MIIAVGTKGMLIKTAGIIHELDSRGINYQYVNLGQHGQRMSDLNKLFGFKPFDINFSKNEDIASIKGVAKWFIEKLWNHKSILNKNNLLVVQGDTPATLLGYLLGKLGGMRIVHVEAGFRSNDPFNPFPEELIRIIVDRGSDFLFPPSDITYNNLIKEKIPSKIIHTKYNTVYDALRIALSKKPIRKVHGNYVLVSIHRVETIYSYRRMKMLVDLIYKIDENVIWPIHPPTKLSLIKHGLLKNLENVTFLELQDYVSFLHMIKNALYIITDGGGPQEESYFLGTPCLIYRKRTEHMEGINESSMLSYFNLNRIEYFLINYRTFRKKSILHDISPSKIIVDFLEKISP